MRKSQRSLAHWHLLSFLCLIDYSLGLSTSHSAVTSQETRAQATQASPGHSLRMRYLEPPQTYLLFPIPGEPPRAGAQFLHPTLTEGTGIFTELQCAHGHLPTFPAHAGWRPLTSALLCPEPHLFLPPRLLHNLLQP